MVATRRGEPTGFASMGSGSSTMAPLSHLSSLTFSSGNGLYGRISLGTLRGYALIMKFGWISNSIPHFGQVTFMPTAFSLACSAVGADTSISKTSRQKGQYRLTR